MAGVRQDLRRALDTLAFRQAGYFTAAQALEVGYSYQAQKHHVDAGNWVRVDRGIFRLPHWPAEAEDSYVRWALWSKGRGVLSHESALSVHGLSDVDPRQIHLTVGRDFHASDEAIVLHFVDLGDEDIESRGAWSLTTPSRTIVDVADGETPQEHVTAALGEALDRGLVTRRRMREESERRSDRAALRVERALSSRESSR